MTWWTTLTRLPRADANWRPHDYKQKVQKMKGLLNKMSFNGETVWRFQTKKFKNSTPPKENKKTTTLQGRKLNIKQVATTKLTEAKLKRAFRIKLFELCKTRTKKSSPDLINFYVVSAGHDLATDAGRATKYRCKFKAPCLQTERTKKGLLKKWVLTGKQFEDFIEKISKIPLLPKRTKQKNHKTPRSKTEHESSSQEEINWSKLEKSIKNKTVWTLQD